MPAQPAQSLLAVASGGEDSRSLDAIPFHPPTRIGSQIRICLLLAQLLFSSLFPCLHFYGIERLTEHSVHHLIGFIGQNRL